MEKGIKLVFTFNRELMQFVIINREIYYTDRVWKNWIRCIPKDEKLIKKIIVSRNKIPIQLAKMFNLSKKEQEEYERCKTNKEVADMIIKDAVLKGCKHEKTMEFDIDQKTHKKTKKNES